MLMYLVQNSRQDIAYAVHSCAKFSHSPKQSDSAAVKPILRYLKGTSTKGMTLNPGVGLTVDCYVDTDFAGAWSAEDPQDSASVKSCSGHLIMFMNCPLIWKSKMKTQILVWKSKMQTQIALSTMEAEYISLSNSMRDVISIRGIFSGLADHVFLSTQLPPKRSNSFLNPKCLKLMKLVSNLPPCQR
mmetsp:Transcript_15176/g.18475  ORF Transcript_15176/g.18475 Transcript_15176/m.18475 type:complete len:187 (+) Transcript_15176:483-1043(+)